MSRKKIGIIIRSLELGGAEKQSVLLAKNLSPNYNVHFFVQHSDKMNERLTEILDDENITLHSLSGNLIKRTFQTARVVKREKLKIIFTYLMIDNILGSLLKFLSPSIKIYGGIRNCLLPTSKFIINKLTHKLFHTQTIFNNISGKDYYISKGFISDKSIVIRNCIESISNPIEREDGDVINIITVGRFVPQKDYLTALKCIKNIIDSGYNIHYQIIGYGQQEDSIRKWINEMNLQNSVNIAIQPSNIYNYYQKADIYLCSSIFEGVSNTIMEAMNFSLPIVATDVGDNRSLVHEGKNGFLAPSGDINLLTENLEKLIKSHELRIKFGLESNAILKTDFSKDTFISNYENIISQNSINQ